MSEEMMLLVMQLGVILLASKFMGWFFSKKLKQSKVLGELIAGMIIGPFMLGAIPLGKLGPMFPMVSGPIPVSVELYGFATIGSIFLLFASGLETDLPTFIRFSGKASIVGFGGVIVSFFLGAGITVLLVPAIHSIMDPEALFLGTICTATSIGITARILNEKKKISTPEGVTILAAAVLDDVISIILLSIVVGIATVEQNGGTIAWHTIGLVAGKAIGFWVLCMVVGIFIAPHITRSLKRFNSLELIAEITFGLALLLAGLSEMVGLAMIIGAYIMGLALSQTDVSFEISERINAVSDYFVSMFFAVMGMMVNFAMIKPVLGFGLIFAIVAFIGKLLGCGLPALFAGFNIRGAFRIGAGMLPRGEVTLIVAGIGLASGAIGEDMFGVAVVTMLLASVAAPPMVVFAFKGGASGYRKSLEHAEEEDIVTIELEFPTERAADFVRRSITEGFRSEGFFIKRLEGTVKVWQIRKEATIFTIKSLETKLETNCKREDEDFVRLMLSETLVDFQGFLDGIKSMESPDMMGANLLIEMFAQEDAKQGKQV
ncbi:Kef-type K+ transport system, membrane component [Sphaerochaeta pleomorpha str. Grapes]|uniref:Kef-type K+ transport system, membrane component n=1 Tax=Sphaerochaeta pleomorpha (strain ATCC BAA-1885 / DSM 22778 / Grapes) TaxID=158190 RepID=G8QRG2_SPHPG|nr:cation:proton antiporter [Sphaerochaeta pleomorpha]AEV28815.1 Kef-type K+ transport system, membrane component [Sphaerochaeta pleomorpha str. Grapes]